MRVVLHWTTHAAIILIEYDDVGRTMCNRALHHIMLYRYYDAFSL